MEQSILHHIFNFIMQYILPKYLYMEKIKCGELIRIILFLSYKVILIKVLLRYLLIQIQP